MGTKRIETPPNGNKLKQTFALYSLDGDGGRGGSNKNYIALRRNNTKRGTAITKQTNPKNKTELN